MWTTCEGGHEWLSLQVKGDERAADTSNAFVEVVQIDTWGDPGWVWSCQADWLIYCIVGTGEALWIRPDAIRAEMHGWRMRVSRKELRWARVPNVGRNGEPYHTLGWLIPIDEFRAIASSSVYIEALDSDPQRFHWDDPAFNGHLAALEGATPPDAPQ